jgi:hypothetical protein
VKRAAAIAAVLLALLACHQREEPIVGLVPQVIDDDVYRHAQRPTTTLAESGAPYYALVLVTVTKNVLTGEDYRLEIVRSSDSKVLWSGSGLKPDLGGEIRVRQGTNQGFLVLIPKSFLLEGEYRLELYGRSGTATTRVTTWNVAVEEGPRR